MKYKGDRMGKKIIATLRGQINDHSLGKSSLSFLPCHMKVFFKLTSALPF